MKDWNSKQNILQIREHTHTPTERKAKPVNRVKSVLLNVYEVMIVYYLSFCIWQSEFGRGA